MHILRKSIIVGLFVVPFIPLIVTPAVLFPFIAGKGFVFRILIELLFGAWLILVLYDARFRPRWSWLLGALAVFVGIIALADIVGVDPGRSIWSNYERMDGLITLAHVFAYFLVAGSVLSKDLWKRWFQTSLAVAVLVSLLGIFQALGVWGTEGARAYATLGNASIFAAYLLVHVFILFFLWTRVIKNKGMHLLYGGMLVLLLLGIYFSATRGAILGLIVGGVCTTVLVAVFEKQRVYLRKIARMLLGVMVLGIVVFFSVRTSTIVQQNPTLSRLANISLSEQTTHSRFVVWDIAWQGFKERPVLGWGQENFIYVFDTYYSPELYRDEPWFDRAHNAVFDWLIAGGILGLLAYLCIYVMALTLVWRTVRLSFSQKSIFTGLFIAYGFQNLFVFDTITTYIFFFSILGFIHSLCRGEKDGRMPERDTHSRYHSWRPYSAVCIGIVTVFLVYGIHAKALLASTHARNALVHTNNEAEALMSFSRALQYRSWGQSQIREQLGLFVGRASHEEGRLKKANQLAHLAASALQEEKDTQPVASARTRALLGNVLARQGHYTQSARELEAALTISPNRVHIHALLADVYRVLGQHERALEHSRTIYELQPRFDHAFSTYIADLIRSRRHEEAETLLVERYGTARIPDPRIIDAYVAIGDYDTVLVLWQKAVHDDPTVLEYQLSLSGAYLQVGRVADAIEVIKTAQQRFPDFWEEGEKYIQAIREGRIRIGI